MRTSHLHLPPPAVRNGGLGCSPSPLVALELFTTGAWSSCVTLLEISQAFFFIGLLSRICPSANTLLLLYHRSSSIFKPPRPLDPLKIHDCSTLYSPLYHSCDGGFQPLWLDGPFLQGQAKLRADPSERHWRRCKLTIPTTSTAKLTIDRTTSSSNTAGCG